jgi:hypothetical protein
MEVSRGKVVVDGGTVDTPSESVTAVEGTPAASRKNSS